VALGGDRVLTTPEYATYLKIGEGCDNRCAYCAIPGIRGKFRSRPIEELVEEAVQLEELGAREISIIAQDITRYGLDLYGEYRLDKLLRAITDATKSVRLRLLYCYPDKITDALVAEIRDNDRIKSVLIVGSCDLIHSLSVWCLHVKRKLYSCFT
jgi:ribosomal protein S12 methylthiotransferase